MAGSTHIIRRSVALALVVAAGFVTAVAVAADKPEDATSPATQALLLRSKGLSDLYGAATVQSWYPAYIRALRLRNNGANEVVFDADAVVGDYSGSTGRLDWADFGIGAGAMLGAVLLIVGIAVGVHVTHKAPARPRAAA